MAKTEYKVGETFQFGLKTLKGGELYTGIEAIKYNILHLLSPVDIEIEDTFTMNGRRYKKLI